MEIRGLLGNRAYNFSANPLNGEAVDRRQILRKVLENGINAFPEPARTILTRRILEAKTFAQISDEVELAKDVVITAFYRNAEKLRKKLGIPV
jgi:DNA-directed RNA polymerase specialized sigma24 family protein